MSPWVGGTDKLTIAALQIGYSAHAYRLDCQCRTQGGSHDYLDARYQSRMKFAVGYTNSDSTLTKASLV